MMHVWAETFQVARITSKFDKKTSAVDKLGLFTDRMHTALKKAITNLTPGSLENSFENCLVIGKDVF